MRLLHLSDPHLLADPAAFCRGRPALRQLSDGLRLTLQRYVDKGGIDWLLLSGDLCHDESWLGYSQLRDLLQSLAIAAVVLPGNHDQPTLLRAALARTAIVAPALVAAGPVDLLLLDSHCPGLDAGYLGGRQLAWLAQLLRRRPSRPLLLALHHPPVPIGDSGFDAIGLIDAEPLLALLRPLPDLQAVLFGHIHQHWQGLLPGRSPSLGPVPLLGCPSTLCGFGPVQRCPLGRSQDPGGRLIDCGAAGLRQQRLLRWLPATVPSLDPSPDSLVVQDL